MDFVLFVIEDAHVLGPSCERLALNETRLLRKQSIPISRLVRRASRLVRATQHQLLSTGCKRPGWSIDCLLFFLSSCLCLSSFKS